MGLSLLRWLTVPPLLHPAARLLHDAAARSQDLAWRSISNSSARSTARKEFMFLTSTLVPRAVAPTGRRETLASQRKAPSSMLAVETPM